MTHLSQLATFRDWQRADDTLVCWHQSQPIFHADLKQRVADLVQSLPAVPGQRWLLWCDSSFEFLVGLLALWQRGHAAILPANAQPDTLRQAGQHCAGLLSDVLPGALATRAARAQRAMGNDEILPIAADAVALQLYTSGSSGDAKAVTRTLRQLQAELAALSQQFPLPNAAVLATVPHHHIYGLLFRLLWPLVSARPFISGAEHYPEPLLAAMTKHAPVVLVSSPAHLERLPAAIDMTALGRHCHQIFSSGAPLANDSAQQFRLAVGHAPLEILGSTETGGVAWRQRQTGDEAEDALWQLLPGVQTRLGKDQLLELCSAAAETQDWCTLGDRVEWVSPQCFRLLGRADRIVKIEAKRLSLTELEQQLLGHAHVAEAAALVQPGARDVVAVVVRLSAVGEAALREGGKLQLNAALRQHLATRFETVLLPRRFRYVREMPRDDRGKLTQQALQALFTEAGA